MRKVIFSGFYLIRMDNIYVKKETDILWIYISPERITYMYKSLLVSFLVTPISVLIRMVALTVH